MTEPPDRSRTGQRGRQSCRDVVSGALQALLVQRGPAGRGRRGPWSPWLRRSDALDIVGWGLAAGRRGDIGRVLSEWGEPPSPSTQASPPERERLQRSAAEVFDDWVAVCGLAADVSPQVLARHHQDTGRSLRPCDLSERLARVLRDGYRDLGRVPDGPEATLLGEKLAGELADLCPWLTDEAFAGQARDAYDRLWDDEGARHLADHPPSRLGLGPDRRPPLKPVAAEDVGGWAQGTARSVYGRYHLHYDTRARTHFPHPQARRPWPRRPDERVEEEVRRSCAPYGLAAPEHHEILVAVAAGANVSGGRHGDPAPAGHAAPAWRGAWRRWISDPDAPAQVRSAPRRPGDPPPVELVLAVRDRVDLWLHASETQLLVQRHGDLGTPADTVAKATVRKVWMGLHGMEREFGTSTAPTRRHDLGRLLRAALAHAVPDALAHDGLVGDLDDATGPTGETGAAHDFAGRRDATVWFLADRATGGAISRLPRWRERLLDGDPDWAADYLALVASSGRDPRGLLTADELADLLRHEWGEL